MVVLTIHEITEYLNDAVVAGANTFVPKHNMATDLIPALSDLLLRLTAAFDIEGIITWFILLKENVASQNRLLN